MVTHFIISLCWNIWHTFKGFSGLLNDSLLCEMLWHNDKSKIVHVYYFTNLNVCFKQNKERYHWQWLRVKMQLVGLSHTWVAVAQVLFNIALESCVVNFSYVRSCVATIRQLRYCVAFFFDQMLCPILYFSHFVSPLLVINSRVKKYI